MKHQRGAVLMLMMATILTVVGALLAKQLLTVLTAKRERLGDTMQRMESVRQALVQYATVNGKLPCPASGAALNTDPLSDTGLPLGATCITNQQASGIVSWRALGLTREQSLDSFGRKLTYRMYQASSTLTVNLASGASNTGVALILISHGATGNGARLPQGGQLQPLPAAANTAERANYSAQGPFYSLQHSDASVADTDNNHFDDVVVYVTRAELTAQARTTGDW